MARPNPQAQPTDQPPRGRCRKTKGELLMTESQCRDYRRGGSKFGCSNFTKLNLGCKGCPGLEFEGQP